MEPFITKLHFKARQQISKLRLSDHSLEIERGRYNRPNLRLEDRTCTFCPEKIADSDERQNLVNSLTRSFPNKVSSRRNKLLSIVFECNDNTVS